jgi:hypothetical protein
MVKIMQEVSCSRCMDSIVHAKGSPLARIACANCRQAVVDPRGKNRGRNGLQLKCALAALTEAQPIDLPDPRTVSRVGEGFPCPECGCQCSTPIALGSHREAHGISVTWPKQQSKGRKR